MKTHDIGRAFWVTLKIKPKTPLLSTAPMRMNHWPYRGGPSLIVRISKHRALVVGWWGDPPKGKTESELLLLAMHAHPVHTYISRNAEKLVKDEDARSYTEAQRARERS